MEVNWKAPWRRVEMIPALEEACGVKFPPGEELHTQETNNFLKDLLRKMKVECSPPLTNARMLDKLVGEFIEETCVNPTFITGHRGFGMGIDRLVMFLTDNYSIKEVLAFPFMKEEKNINKPLLAAEQENIKPQPVEDLQATH
ncbi:hypothetical protein DH86_00003665 [Scytalidium sp. 3C]|nr:hypothetical protein DH86_00003665 [Scytalidium sp. 3C]